MPRLPAEIRRHPFRSLGPVALLALAPKCAMCVLAYAGLGAVLGLRGAEICGAGAGPTGGWATALALCGAGLGIAGWLARRS
jgi:hypothetical protein